jgi:hypothetical protein
MSFTKAVTNLEAAWPIMNAIARPIIPKVFRKKMNSWVKPLFFSLVGDDTGASGPQWILYKHFKVEFSANITAVL